MRIGFVYDALVPYRVGGAERRFHELASRLATRHDVHYVTWGFWGPERSIERDGIRLHSVGSPRGFYGQDGKRTIREAAEFAVRLPAALARLNLDVLDVSATPYLPLYAAWATSRVTRTAMVATWHEFWGEHWAAYLPERRAIARVARLAEAGARPLADRRVAVSEFTRRRLAAGRGRSGPAIDVVGNGVNLAAMAGGPIDDERADLVYVGRLIDEKRVDLLLEAIARLAGRYPTLRCTIVGDGPERERLAVLTTELGVDAHVRFVGAVDDERIPTLLRAARILVLPSIREGYGIAVVEAQACGLVPVVVRSALSAATDLVADDRDGVICDPTATGLAAALAALLDDPERLDRIAAAARKTAAARDWDGRARDMERIYREVAGVPRPALGRSPSLALDGDS